MNALFAAQRIPFRVAWMRQSFRCSAVGRAGYAPCLVSSHGYLALIPDASGPVSPRATLAHPSGSVRSARCSVQDDLALATVVQVLQAPTVYLGDVAAEIHPGCWGE